MGVEVIATDDDTKAKPHKDVDTSDLTEQTEIQPSPQACFDVVQGLKDARPLLSLVAPGLNPDLNSYLFKQPNESWDFTDNQATRPGSMEIGAMRPGLYGQRANRSTDRALDGPDNALLDKPAYFADMQDVFGNSKYFDLVRNHNQVISTPGSQSIAELTATDGHADSETVEAAKTAIQEKPDEPTILFNFDSHSDMWTGPVAKGQESIAQWVNAVLKTNPNVNEVYWVLPKDFKDNPEIRPSYFDHQGDMPDYDTVFVFAKPDMELYLDKNSGALLTKKPDDYSEEAYRTIQFHKRTMDELPDFAGKRTAVSIDLDFFDNRGYDTTLGASVNYQGEQGFADFVQTLKDRNIRPAFTTVSASPEYVRDNHMRDLLRFSSLVAESTQAKMDAVVVPAQNQVYSTRPHDSIQINRGGDKTLQLFYELFKIDSQTARPNDSINLQIDGPKLRAALDATRRVFGSPSDEAARQILNRLDAADGNANGVLEFEAIESLIVRVCASAQPERLKKDPSK